MELKRDIYKQLLDWKKRDSHKVLELRVLSGKLIAASVCKLKLTF